LPYNATGEKTPGAAPCSRQSYGTANSTHTVLDSFFGPDVRVLAALLPALEIKKWWPAAYFRRFG